MEDINKSKDSFFTVEEESDLKLYKDIGLLKSIRLCDVNEVQNNILLQPVKKELKPTNSQKSDFNTVLQYFKL